MCTIISTELNQVYNHNNNIVSDEYSYLEDNDELIAGPDHVGIMGGLLHIHGHPRIGTLKNYKVLLQNNGHFQLNIELILKQKKRQNYYVSQD